MTLLFSMMHELSTSYCLWWKTLWRKAWHYLRNDLFWFSFVTVMYWKEFKSASDKHLFEYCGLRIQSANQAPNVSKPPSGVNLLQWGMSSLCCWLSGCRVLCPLTSLLIGEVSHFVTDKVTWVMFIYFVCGFSRRLLEKKIPLAKVNRSPKSV